MNQTIFIIVFSIALTVVTTWLIIRARHSTAKWREKQQFKACDIASVTRLGVKVQSVKPLTGVIREGIDQAFVKFQTIAEIVYRRSLDPTMFKIWVWPSVRDYNIAGLYSPVFKTYFGPYTPYDESQYDQEPGKPGGWTFSAERCISPLENKEMIIPEANVQTYVANCVHNGLDHIVAFMFNGYLYQSTESHAGAWGHPIHELVDNDTVLVHWGDGSVDVHTRQVDS